VFPARLPAGGILRPALRFHTKLAANPPDHDSADLHSRLQTPARKPQQTKLHREAQPIGISSPLTDQGKVGLAEGIVAGKLLFRLGRLKESGTLSGGKEAASRHFSL
jgi:hypothetical protein